VQTPHHAPRPSAFLCTGRFDPRVVLIGPSISPPSADAATLLVWRLPRPPPVVFSCVNASVCRCRPGVSVCGTGALQPEPERLRRSTSSPGWAVVNARLGAAACPSRCLPFSSFHPPDWRARSIQVGVIEGRAPKILALSVAGAALSTRLHAAADQRYAQRSTSGLTSGAIATGGVYRSDSADAFAGLPRT